MIQSQSQKQNNKNTLWVHCNEAEKWAILAWKNNNPPIKPAMFL